MRVIAGKHRSRPLAEFKGRDIRPTSDRAKEALFNILQTKIFGSSFLDLYCGTGNIGIEAISRGAEKVIFVDSAKESVALTKSNLAYLKEDAKVMLSDAYSFLAVTDEKFDIIFLDPPYKDDAEEVLKIIAERNLVASDGVVIYEHKDKYEKEIEGLTKKSTRTYGIAVFEFYEVSKK